MRTARRALVAMALSLSAVSSAAAPSRALAASPPDLTGSASWAKDPAGTSFGFSSLSVTQSGVTYAPSDPATALGAEAAAPLADLPAWAAPTQVRPPPRRGVLATLGFAKGGNLPEFVIWALLLTGFAIIGGAIRGLIVVNRRLNRLRAEEAEEEES